MEKNQKKKTNTPKIKKKQPILVFQKKKRILSSLVLLIKSRLFLHIWSLFL